VRVLVTGASGFVGGRLVERLRRDHGAGIALTGWDRTPSPHGEAETGIAWRSVDLNDGDSVDAAIRMDRPDRVYHLAGLSSVKQAEGAAAQACEVNVGGTAALARALYAHAPGAALIFAGSGTVYGAAFNSGEPLTEQAAVRPLDAYARSKLAGEIVLQDMLAERCPVIALRLLNHSGPGQDERFVVPSFAAQIARIEKGLVPATLSVGNLEVERDFLDVEDVIDAYLAALRIADQAVGFQLYNVASGKPRSIASILERLIALSRAKPEVERASRRVRAGEIASTRCDSSAFRTRTGWRPTRDFDDTIAAILDWWRARVG
jgi:GDP-4-dehydro-6-deoxy-D-mannose reductase